jgi:hypothetical protein
MRKEQLLGPTVVILATCLFAGCRAQFPAVPPWETVEVDGVLLTGWPTWFPLGEEVYFEDGHLQAEQEVLCFQPETRWFKGFSKEADKATFESRMNEYVARLRAAGGSWNQMKVEDDPNRRYFLATQPPYPHTPSDIPAAQHGVRLALAVRKANDPAILVFELTLSSEFFVLTREVEHRNTNVVPFLFSFYADGQAVWPFSEEPHGIIGGNSWMWPLVEKGGSKKWSYRVNKASIAQLLGRRRPGQLAVLAAFSQRQHDYWGGFGDLYPQGDMLTRAPDDPPQVVVRSNVVHIPWGPEGEPTNHE